MVVVVGGWCHLLLENFVHGTHTLTSIGSMFWHSRVRCCGPYLFIVEVNSPLLALGSRKLAPLPPEIPRRRNCKTSLFLQSLPKVLTIQIFRRSDWGLHPPPTAMNSFHTHLRYNKYIDNSAQYVNCGVDHPANSTSCPKRVEALAGQRARANILVRGSPPS